MLFNQAKVRTQVNNPRETKVSKKWQARRGQKTANGKLTQKNKILEGMLENSYVREETIWQ